MILKFLFWRSFIKKKFISCWVQYSQHKFPPIIYFLVFSSLTLWKCVIQTKGHWLLGIETSHACFNFAFLPPDFLFLKKSLKIGMDHSYKLQVDLTLILNV